MKINSGLELSELQTAQQAQPWELVVGDSNNNYDHLHMCMNCVTTVWLCVCSFPFFINEIKIYLALQVDYVCGKENMWLWRHCNNVPWKYQKNQKKVSISRATHRQRGGHGFESRWSPDFFQASSFQLLKLENLVRWSFFTFIYNRSSKMNYFIYTSH